MITLNVVTPIILIILRILFIYIIYRVVNWIYNYRKLFNNINKFKGPKALYLIGNAHQFGKRHGKLH